MTLPANGLVDASGAAATGNVTVNLSVIDPKSNAAAMPGDYTTSTGTSIESFGAIKVTLLSSTGAPLNLAAGKIATIRIPVSSVATPDATIPLFYFNETTGKWVQEGSATLQGTAPNQYYEGTVTHFTYWNADRPMDTIYVNGCLKDAAGAGIANASVLSNGVNYTGLASAKTDAAGNFRVAMMKNGVASVYAANGSNAATAGPSASDITLPACLSPALSQAPIILTQPANLTIASGGSGAIGVAASVTGCSYQWYKNGVAIAGANSASLRLSATNNATGNTFYVVVSNAAGSATSQTVTLTVTPPPAVVITINQQPRAVTATVGGLASFSVEASISNFTALTYQWRKNGVAISGATAATYGTPVLTLADNGAQFSVVLTGGGVSSTSANALLTVNPVASTLTPVEQMRTILVWGVASYATSKPLDLISEDAALNGEGINGYFSDCTTGSMINRLDGVMVNGGALPVGSHTLSVTASNCENSGDLENGVTSIAYSFASANGSKLNGTATSTVTNYRDKEVGFFDFTVNGGAALTLQSTRVASNTGNVTQTNFSKTIVFTPSATTTVRDNVNARTFTYVSGSTNHLETTNYAVNPANTTQQIHTFSNNTTFNDLRYSFGTDVFKLTGTIGDTDVYTTNAFTSRTETYTAQINLYRNDVLVGFLKQHTSGPNIGDLYMSIDGVITLLFP